MVRRVIYLSHTMSRLPDETLDRLLREIWERNLRDNITGMLLYKARTFLQVLEGEDAIVETTLERVFRNPLHSRMKIMSDCRNVPRLYEEWHMGFRRMTSPPIDHEAYFSLTRRALLARIPPGAAADVRRLITGYRDAKMPRKLERSVAPPGVVTGQGMRVLEDQY